MIDSADFIKKAREFVKLGKINDAIHYYKAAFALMIVENKDVHTLEAYKKKLIPLLKAAKMFEDIDYFEQEFDRYKKLH